MIRKLWPFLLAVTILGCADGLDPSSVAGVYERLDTPYWLATTVQAGTHNGEPAIEETSLWSELERFTLARAGTWTSDFSRSAIVKMYVGNVLADSSKTVTFSSDSGTFTLSPPDSILFSNSLRRFGGTIVPPDLVFGGVTFTRR